MSGLKILVMSIDRFVGFFVTWDLADAFSCVMSWLEGLGTKDPPSEAANLQGAPGMGKGLQYHRQLQRGTQEASAPH